MNAITKIGIGVGTMVMRDDKVLLGLRNPDKEKASSELQGQGTWTMPGGKVDEGEKLIEAAYRELAEETGIANIDLQFIALQDDITDFAHYVTAGFIGELSRDIEPQVLEPETIMEWRWFDLNDLPENMYFPSRKFIEKYQNEVSYG